MARGSEKKTQFLDWVVMWMVVFCPLVCRTQGKDEIWKDKGFHQRNAKLKGLWAPQMISDRGGAHEMERELPERGVYKARSLETQRKGPWKPEC